MIFLVMIVAVDLVWVMAIYRPESAVGLGLHYLDLPLLVLFNVLAGVGYPLLARRTVQAFRVGFLGGGLYCSAVYIVLFRTYPGLITDVSLDFALPIQEWVIPPRFQPGNPGYSPRLALFYAVMGVIGSIPLVGLAAAFGLLTSLVAKGKVSWLVALAIVVLSTGSGVIKVRRSEYQKLEIQSKEVCEILSREAAEVSQELERLKSAENPPSLATEDQIKRVQEQLARYEVPLVKARRSVEIYRRVTQRPWLMISEK
jgi:hypothetical protein